MFSGNIKCRDEMVGQAGHDVPGLPGGKQTKFGNAVAPPLFGNVFQALPLLGIPGTDKGAGLDQTETHLTVDGQVLRSDPP